MSSSGIHGASDPTTAQESAQHRRQQQLRSRLLSAGLVIVLAAIVVFFATQTSGFLSIGNARNIARDVALIGLVAVGMTMLVLTANIDLSVGAMLGLTGVLTGRLLVEAGLSFGPTILIVLLAGVGLGLFNGVLVAVVGINPIITTLATWTGYRGLAFLLTGGVPIFGFPSVVNTLGYGGVLGVPYTVWIMLTVFGAGWLFLYRTPYGRRIYALGGNQEAARLAGVRVRSYIVSLYAFVGFLAAVAGILASSRFQSAHPSAGTGFEIAVITAVFVGGISLSGGEGRLGGVFMGVVILGVLQNGMTLMAVQPFVQQVVLGAFLLVAVAFDQALSRISHSTPFVLRDPSDAPLPDESSTRRNEVGS